MGLLELASAALVGAERRTEIAARNIANARTPGYKREIPYTEIAGQAPGRAVLGGGMPVTRSAVQSALGVLTDTQSPLDLAINGTGYLLLRGGDQFYLSRGGQFRRDAEGALTDGNGRIVQQSGGGDLILDTDTPEILADGNVLSAKVPVGTVALVAADPDLVARAGAGLTLDQATALVGSGASELRQGMLERSNVVLSDEMVGLMRNQRLGEGGAQLIRAYDELIGQAVSTFGRKTA
jgi:flagellar basal-body rod protein FlgF